MNPEETYELITSGGIYSDIKDHLPLLREAARGNCLEIGVRGGCSTAALLVGLREHKGHLWSVDVVNYGQHFEDREWSFIHGHSVQDAPRILEQLPKHLDLFFLDADHIFETTLRELQIYGALISPGGKILAHDTDLPGAGVRAAIEAYSSEIGKVPIYHSGSFGMAEIKF